MPKLQEKLKDFERLWRQADATAANSLRPPLTRVAVVAELAVIGVPAHGDLISLWTWHDGQSLERQRHMFAQRFFFLPLSHATVKYQKNLELWDVIRADAPDAYAESWVPIFMDHDKFQVLFDCETGEVRGYGHEVGATGPLQSLDHLIRLWSQALQVGGWSFPAPDGFSVYEPNVETMELVAKPGSVDWDFLV